LKVSYRDSLQRQADRHPSQRELREGVVQRSGRLGWILLGLLGALAVVLALWLYRAGRVHTYGVVTTGMNLFHAPVRSTVRAVQVEPGDHVSADQLLFVLDSSEAATELGQVHSELERERQRLRDLEQADQGDPGPQRARDLWATRERIIQLERELTALDDVRQAAVLEHSQLRQQLQHRRRHLQGQRERQQQRSASLAYLLEQGAATRSEHEHQRREQARLELEVEDLGRQLARIDALEALDSQTHAQRHQALQENLEASRRHAQALAAAYQAQVEERRREQAQQVLDAGARIAGLETRIAYLEHMAGPTEVRALADGVVMEVAVSVGSTVAKDGIIMSVAGTGKLWISGFIPADEAKRITVGDRARIRPTAGGGPLSGRVTAGGGLEYKVHPALRSRFREFSAVYARIDLDDGGQELIPGNVVEVVIEP
jgi:multidrug resistance efflux pump